MKYLYLYETLLKISTHVVVFGLSSRPRSTLVIMKLVVLSSMILKNFPIQPKGGGGETPRYIFGFPFPLPAMHFSPTCVLFGLHCFFLSPLCRRIAVVRDALGLPGWNPNIAPYVSEGTH